MVNIFLNRKHIWPTVSATPADILQYHTIPLNLCCPFSFWSLRCPWSPSVPWQRVLASLARPATSPQPIHCGAPVIHGVRHSQHWSSETDSSSPVKDSLQTEEAFIKMNTHSDWKIRFSKFSRLRNCIPWEAAVEKSLVPNQLGAHSSCSGDNHEPARRQPFPDEHQPPRDISQAFWANVKTQMKKLGNGQRRGWCREHGTAHCSELKISPKGPS